MSAPTAALVIVGQELLSGKVEDENISFLTRELFQLGVEVKRILIVADVEEEIVEAVRWVYQRHDVVFTTGGLGPTHDDVTIMAVAAALERKMVHSAGLERLLETRYGLTEGPERMRLSRIPEGSELFYPETGRFPQLKVGNVYLFPGVPALVKSKFAAIADRFRSDPIFSEAIELDRTELEIVGPLTAAVDAYPGVRFGSYPKYEKGQESVKLTLDSQDRGALDDALALLKRLLRV